MPTVALDPPPRAGKFTLDLDRPGAFVPQFTRDWCVASAMQTMINLMTPGRPDRTRATQQHLYDWAREISPWTEQGPGASIQGWIGGLEQLGLGDFEELAFDTRAGALRTVARQMRMTGRPVGLWVWRGDHAWVVSGFKSTADPAFTDDFRVTAVWIEDPWSGRVSSIWGKGLDPHTLVTADELAAGFTRFSSVHRPQYGPKGLYTIIAPLG